MATSFGIFTITIFTLLVVGDSSSFNLSSYTAASAAAFAATSAFNRSIFPAGFVFGTASSAYQYEGAAFEGGRGPSIWDTFSATKGKIIDGSSGAVAIDEYHRYNYHILKKTLFL